QLGPRTIQLGPQLQAGGSDARGDIPAVAVLALALDEAHPFETIEQAAGVGHLCPQPVAYLVAAEALLAGPPQHAQGVVLGAGDAAAPDRLVEGMAQH